MLLRYLLTLSVLGIASQLLAQTPDPASQDVSELQTLRAENAMLRRQVERLTAELATLRQQLEGHASTERDASASDSAIEKAPALAEKSKAPATGAAALPTDQEVMRFRMLLHRVGRNDANAAEELAALRTDIIARLEEGQEGWTVHDVETRCKIDRRICSFVASEPGATWQPLIRMNGPVSNWAAAAPDRDQLVTRLRVYERYVSEEQHVTWWDPSHRRAIISNVAGQWMTRRRDTYATEWDRQQFRQWLASKGIKSLAANRPAD